MTLLRPLPGSFPRFAIVAFVLAVATRLFAANYYVDFASGSDNNPGTSTSAPWQHCPGDPSAAGYPSLTSLAAGDTVFFKGGVTYVLTGTTGIQLRWNGSSGSPITYDGNSSGAWGTGAATFTDNNGGNGLAAFSASTAASYLNFKSLNFTGIGGSAALPPDTGSPVAARFGAGILFNAGVSNATIDRCVFHDLGYWFNQKPMNAASISGTGIGFSSCDTVTISNSDFYHVASGIEMFRATSVANLTVTNCTFHDSVLWTVDMPSLPVTATNFQISGCSETNNAQFTSASWTGYGYSPRTLVQTVTAGASVTLNVQSAAAPAAQYQWRKNGTAISGATNATLTLNAVSSADTATYTVVATNTAGATTSNDAIVNVNAATTASGTAPVITTQPVSQVGAPSGSVTFTVSASGNPTPTYQWYRDGVTFSGWTGSSLTLSGLSSNDVGTYTAVATNSAGSATSAGATLTLSTSTTTTPPPPTTAAIPPVITTQPVSQTAAAMSTVTFTVAASGTPAPTYQWLKNGVAIPGWTSATLTLSAVTTNDVATYSAVATNSAGSATSNGATLTLASTTTTPPPPTTTAGAPVITTQPVNQTVAALSTATFTVAASGTPAPTYQWLKNGVAIPGWTSATLTLPAVTTNDVATYSAVATNSAGSATSNGATLTLATSTTTPPPPTAVAPVITTQPLSQSVAPKSTVTFSVVATGTPAPTYQWMKNGNVISGATATSFTIRNVNSSSAGTYSVKVSNSAGSVVSNGAVLTVSSNSPKVVRLSTSASTSDLTVTSVPLAQTVTAGTTAQFSVAATSSSALTYQWTKDDVPVSGATSNTLVLDNVQTTQAGAYAVTVNDSSGSLTTDPAALLVTAPGTTPSRLANLSVRGSAGTGSNTLIMGFVVAGSPSKSLLVRGVGPTLASYGVAGALPDPVLSLYSGTSLLGSNNSWTASSDMSRISTVSANVGAFRLGDASADAALLPTLTPGAYTAHVVAKSGATGTALVELYDAQPGTDARLTNVSVRTTIAAAADKPIIGFVVTGATPKQLLIRAVGPTLSGFGVEGVLAEPQVEIYKDGTVTAQNSGWAGDLALQTAFNRVGAFSFASPDSKDSALLFTAEPGAYTAVVSGVNGATGVVMLEVYELP